MWWRRYGNNAVESEHGVKDGGGQFCMRNVGMHVNELLCSSRTWKTPVVLLAGSRQFWGSHCRHKGRKDTHTQIKVCTKRASVLLKISAEG